MTTNTISTLKIFDENWEEIYFRKFEADIYIVDFDLMYNNSILMLICEDVTTTTREVMAIDFRKGEYIQPPSLNASHSLFSIRSI